MCSDAASNVMRCGVTGSLRLSRHEPRSPSSPSPLAHKPCELHTDHLSIGTKYNKFNPHSTPQLLNPTSQRSQAASAFSIAVAMLPGRCLAARGLFQSRGFCTSIARMAEGDTGSPQFGGTKSHDAFRRREAASEAEWVRRHEMEKLENLKKKIAHHESQILQWKQEAEEISKKGEVCAACGQPLPAKHQTSA